MDFIKIIRSLEEFLYEVITWLLLYPRTVWRVATSPIAMMRYSQRQLAEAPDKRFMDALSPPLLLMITLALTHVIEQAVLGGEVQARGMMRRMMDSEQNLLIVRSVAYAIFPLMYAIGELRQHRLPLDRETMRAPFYAQCYLAAVFALFLALATIGAQAEGGRWRLLGASAAIATTVRYLYVQVRWLREGLAIGRARSLWLAMSGFSAATAVVVGATLLLSSAG